MTVEECQLCGRPRKLWEWHPYGATSELRICAACLKADRAKRAEAAQDNGGVQPGAGRPASADPRSSKVLLTFTRAEMALVAKAAASTGEKPAGFGRVATLERAHRLLGTHKSK